MTNATMALAELAENGTDVDVLRQMVQFMAQRLMELDVEGRCGAGYDEKNPERINSRHGYRERSREARAGAVELKLPNRQIDGDWPYLWVDATYVKKREAGASLRGEFPKLGKLMDDEVFTPTCTAWASGRIWPAPS